ncbi:MobF family relaxase [Kordiimonas sp.]|uniref:MobF family relaxase n=1 Tax=Kordiimonas sp. TaxID=1970157 RepID=UPI003B51A92C
MIGNIRKIHDGEVFGYLAEDNYYIDSDTVQLAFWEGKLAKRRRLSSGITKKTFDAQLAKNTANKNQRKTVLGYDIVFSAPKSVSVLALAFEDEEIRNSHREAVKAALAFIEGNCLQYRKFQASEKKQVLANADNCLFAVFEHHENRALDPQLHSHSFLFQQTVDKSGRTRALETHRLFKHKMAAGIIYQAELARNIHQLGYQTQWCMRKGTFEIKGVPQDIIDAFSTRRAELLKKLAESGSFSHKKADLAALFTRSTKAKNVDRTALRKAWQAKAESLGFTKSSVQACQLEMICDEKVAPELIVEDALSHLSENEAVFEKRRLIFEAIKLSRGRIEPAKVLAAIDQAIEAKAILTMPDLEDYLTVPSAVMLEQELLAHEKAGRGTTTPTVREDKLWKDLQGAILGPDQAQAVAQILASTSSVVGVQGYAGTGKTTLLRVVREQVEKTGKRIFALAPSTEASATLHQETGIPANTLQFFLSSYANNKRTDTVFAGSIVLLDEASMVSSQQMADLFKLQKTLGIERICLIGDRAQLNAVEAGRPFELLQENGMEIAEITNIRRQKNGPLKGAVHDVIKKDLQAAFRALRPAMVENPDQELAFLMARDWIRLPLAQRTQSLILTQTRAERLRVNEIIRTYMRSKGQLGQPTFNTSQLIPRSLSKAQIKSAAYYEAGDVVLFNKPYVRLEVQRGTYAKVIRADQNNDTVELALPCGRTVIWSPQRIAANAKGAIDVFETETMEMAPGDEIRFTRNFHKYNIRNGTRCQVAHIDGENVYLRDERGKNFVLGRNMAPLKHIDYAWATTTHGAQGRTVDQVFVLANSQHGHMNTASSLYVQISRARYSARLYTDDAEELEIQTLKSLEPKPRHATDLVKDPEIYRELKASSEAFSRQLLETRRRLQIEKLRRELRAPEPTPSLRLSL